MIPADLEAARPRRRWYCLTSGRLALALLAAEALLWLSARFRLFAFHKGWTVLIAVVAVGVRKKEGEA